MEFKLKNDRTYRVAWGLPRTPETISNENMTKALALRFIRKNPGPRKALFEVLPENIDELLEVKPKKSRSKK